ncbi:hypothetical protein PYCCODRAFT_1445831 [Trametes coccinea BRFM310]|uniref:Uncharacterized protein n=1 Tax=Trametes coccinea (strain BRFM310) TaxID=1353009 RepID=A0A1Y2IL97_TRAC3|nr:hypothetical protein PYCCODRAFT_1445831 [Trametes coccinea BRFM310]
MLYSEPPALELHRDPVDGSSSDMSFEGRAHLMYPVPDMREVKPGVLASGQWTVNHPLVDAYLAALARLAPRQRPQQAPGASVPSTATTSPATTPQSLPDSYFPSLTSGPLVVSTPQNEADRLRWRAYHGGIASVHTVAQVITVQYELFPGPGSAWYAAQVGRLSEEQKRAVFALAALKVLNHPTHPAHWALWAKNVLRRTAQVVEEIFQLKPCPIVSHVGWIGIPESIWALSGLQSTFIPPPPPQPEKPKAGGMTLRKRKVPATTSSSSVATHAAEDEPAPLRVSPRKRQRTTRAQAALAQAQQLEEEAAAAAAPPESIPASSSATSESTSGPVTPSESGSMLLDVPLPSLVSKAVKQELVDIAGASDVLQPLELALDVPDVAPAPAHDAASSRARSTASLSPNIARRSTRARRKPAQGPVTLSASPLSALSTPTTSPAPLPSHDAEKQEPQEHAEKKAKRVRAGSCGSSTAVSEAGEASEGTVVVDMDGVAEVDSVPAKGKRKAIEIEEEADAAPVENPQGAVTPTAPTTNTSKGNAKKSRSKAGGAARPKKRVKIDDASSKQAVVALPPTVPNASGEENVPPAPAPAKKKASGGKRKTAAAASRKS